MINDNEQIKDLALSPILNQQFLRASYYFRDITASGYASLTTETETTIISAVASRYLDLIYVSGSTTSDGAVSVDLRSGTGGSVLDTIVIPGTGVIGNMWHKYDVPLLAAEQATPWTAQVSGDVSNTTITITMVAIKNSKRN